MSISELIGKFQFVRILKSDSQTKTISLLGSIDNEHAIITLEKSHFQFENHKVNELIQDISLINNNDIYYWSIGSLLQQLPELPGAKINLIYPATETHIHKYDEQTYHYIRETPAMYEKYVVPYIKSMKGDRIKWVYNILFEGKESETFVYHDKDPSNGFVLLPDMKWDTINLQTLYLCCIVNRLDISSVRDLNENHIEFLESLQEKVKQITVEKYNIGKNQLRIFIHYQPSYYHFHIHIVNVAHPGLGDGIAVGKAILLDDVIDNLKLDGDYYKKKTIGYLLGENHGLWKIEGYTVSNN
ncbi:uncharacterized protein SPAPADRAFT_144541 [Spathaspora passalidarum NRRL Y-27907]|uniref:Scavenger mRNA decapping enzyme n=1 Tax=Spathaspora passalidarum (strain NRRL Y-27907 / 11-Y1) TaxID=619300 RepID=G3AV54_SPAPN|nr:uncharacterized protein SPAPADRAFT_144541 [Spathaspora passalidarum NRRL Y-27907]EGW30128.1 hypothetical protein SPAPADRAFT_144541 [Spathaspora passalidarum NRRL Y-27907]